MYGNPTCDEDVHGGLNDRPAAAAGAAVYDSFSASDPDASGGGAYVDPVRLESGPDEGSRLFMQQLDTYASAGGARAAQTVKRKMPRVTARRTVTIIERLGGGLACVVVALNALVVFMRYKQPAYLRMGHHLWRSLTGAGGATT